MWKPSEITDDEWDSLTSPENYFCDGEVSRAQADKLFKQKVESIVASRRKTPVADTGTVTYSHLRSSAEKCSEPFIDDETPAGHFGVTVKNISGVSTYWLKGQKGDPNAVVVGRNQGGVSYKGGGVLGGEYRPRPSPSPRKEWVGAQRARKTMQKTNAAAVSRVLNAEAGGGYVVAQRHQDHRVLVQRGASSRSVQWAAEVLTDKQYVYSMSDQSLVVSVRYV